jgi:hypothetical protein
MRAGLFAVVCAAALVLPAPAALAAETWAGTWDTDFGMLTLDAGGSGSYTGFSPGTVSGTVNGNVNKGTWSQPGNPPKSGTFEWTMSPGGQSFTGVWAYDGGGCGTACGWNGRRCVAGPCLENGKPAPAPAPTPTPTPAAPKPPCAGAARVAQTAPIVCAAVLSISSANTRPPLVKTTAFRAPSPGEAGTLPLPKVRDRTAELEGQLTFVDKNGRVLPPLPIAALEEQAERAHRVCSIMYLSDLVSFSAGRGTGAYGTCLLTVTQILARSDEIKRRRAPGGSSSVAAQRGCATSIARRGKAVSRLRVSCVRTATGVRVTIRPRESNQTLRNALRGRTPRLIIGRSAVGAHAAGDRLNVLWKATNLSLL